MFGHDCRSELVKGMGNPMESKHIKTFIFAGNARFTLVSKVTGARFTYRLRASEKGDVFFASLLTGSDNENSYSYLGIIKADHDGWQDHAELRSTRKSRISPQAPGFRALEWFLRHIGHDAVECHHEGRCGKCGRALTVPESIETGLGPVCAAGLAA